MAACAMLPVMSCRYIRQSKPMDELKSSARRSVCPSVRPAHIFAMLAHFLFWETSEEFLFGLRRIFCPNAAV